ncbi:MAG: hypothetical protein DRJ09_10525, partial [Bacteroidetes bacterium]
MKRIFKYGLVVVFFTLSVNGLPYINNKSSGSNLKTSYETKQQYFQKQVQRYWYISPDTSLLFADSALSMAKRKNKLRDLSYFNLLKGIAYYYQGKNALAITTFKKSLRYKQGGSGDKLTASTNNMLSLVYRNIGKYDSAIYYSKKALYIREHNTKDSNDIAGSCDNLSTIYNKTGEYDSAIIYSLKAAKIFEKLRNKRELAYTWGNLSNLYNATGNKKNSYRFLKMAYEILKQDGNEGDYAEILENLGGYFFDSGSLDSAMFYFKKASALYKKLERYDGYGDSKRAIGEIYLRLEENKKAEREFTEAYQQFKKSKRIVDLIETKVFLAEIELRKSNYSKAKQYLEDASSMEKNIHSNKLRLRILKEKEKLMEQWEKQT